MKSKGKKGVGGLGGRRGENRLNSVKDFQSDHLLKQTEYQKERSKQVGIEAESCSDCVSNSFLERPKAMPEKKKN